MHYEKFQNGTVKCIEKDIPFDVPEGWAWARLGTMCRMTNGIPKRSGKGGVDTIVLRLADLDDNTIIYDNCRLINLKAAEVEKYSLHFNDLLFVRVNGSKLNVGKCYCFQGHSEPTAYCDHVIRGCVDSTIMPSLLYPPYLPHSRTASNGRR